MAYRYFQWRVRMRTYEANLSPVRRTSIMADTQQSWIVRLFFQPVAREVSQATEWDNDIPPFPILAGEDARAERRGSSK